ncbi:MAG: tRNA guanosine(34) transglycosylase Tgt [Candidatus Pacebacteria bacterium]|nr:tRNA guanosine(34) transglycosylase Tgt [Candidatus Paceibacterota bacterium]
MLLKSHMISFSIHKKSRLSKARLGTIVTSHGEVQTPAFVGVATQATVKTLSSEEIPATKTQLLIANTYHLHLKPGELIIKKHGGLHSFMNWRGPLMTDSGGYQVFSLGFGRDFGTNKISQRNQNEHISVGAQPKLLTINDDGVRFISYVDGTETFLGPKESIRIQERIGADIMIAFDECPSPLADYAYNIQALKRTHLWAEKCISVKKSDQALYGVIQGGRYKKLRVESAQYINTLPFDGFAIGGEFGARKQSMSTMLSWVTKHLNEKKPRHLLGIGHVEDLRRAARAGMDTFDCIVPTHYARHGYAFTSSGKMDLNKRQYIRDTKALDRSCACYVCQTYTRSYIAHLLKAKEITALRLLTQHNLFYFNTLMERIRFDIKKGVL